MLHFVLRIAFIYIAAVCSASGIQQRSSARRRSASSDETLALSRFSEAPARARENAPMSSSFTITWCGRNWLSSDSDRQRRWRTRRRWRRRAKIRRNRERSNGGVWRRVENAGENERGDRVSCRRALKNVLSPEKAAPVPASAARSRSSPRPLSPPRLLLVPASPSIFLRS